MPVRVVVLATLVAICLGRAFAEAGQPPKPKPSIARPATSASRLSKPDSSASFLLIKVDDPGVVIVDGESIEMDSSGKAKALDRDGTKRVQVAAGEHLVEARSPDGVDRWRKAVSVERGSQALVEVRLAEAREKREADEQARVTEDQQRRARQQRDADEAAERAAYAERTRRERQAAAEAEAAKDRAREEAARQFRQPWVGLSRAQVTAKLGLPNAVNHTGGEEQWSYHRRGLLIVFRSERVADARPK